MTHFPYQGIAGSLVAKDCYSCCPTHSLSMKDDLNEMSLDRLAVSLRGNVSACIKSRFHEEFPDKTSSQIDSAIGGAKLVALPAGSHGEIERMARAQLSMADALRTA